MADLLSRLLSFPPDKKKFSAKDYDTRVIEYISDLNKIPEKEWTKHIDKKNLLELLDPTTNSIAYLYTLVHQIQACSKDDIRLQHLTDLAVLFLSSFDTFQVRYVGAVWRGLWEWVSNAIRTASGDVIPLVVAILRLDPSAGTFTCNHLTVVRLSLLNGVPSQVLPILDRDVYAYPQKPSKNLPNELICEEHDLSNAFITEPSGLTAKVTPETVLEYYLLGAHIYIGQRNLNRARLFLELILLSPTQQHVSSALQVEAYKKWALVGLLSQGVMFPIPKTLDQGVVKSVRALSKPYDALALSFERRDQKKFQAEAQMGEKIWQEDGNTRLVTEVANALTRYGVIDLQKTYAALPVARVAEQLGLAPDVAHELVTETIQGGHLNASVSDVAGDAVLKFHADASTSPAYSDDNLEAQALRIANLVKFIDETDRRLQLTKEYVEYMKRAKRTDGDIADAMDLSWDGPTATNAAEDDGDEDIMAS